MNTEKIIQITAGRGPAECCWVVAQLLKSLLKELKQLKLDVCILTQVKGDQPRTLKSATLLVRGQNLESLNTLNGSILWIGKSPYRKYHKRKNWFVGVSVFQPIQKIDWNERDLSFQTFRSSGPGGQAVNKLETAVRVKHGPSGISATAQEARSQAENKKIALQRLKEVIKNKSLERLAQHAEEQWFGHLSLERGNPKRVYEGREFRLKKQN